MEELQNHIFTVGDRPLDLGRPVVMAIINVTPDSFWHESRADGEQAVRRAAARAVADGAAILDVGGYSSRPGADDVSPEQEALRIFRAMDVIRREHPDAVVSVDTFRARMAVQVVERYGPCIINDISAGELDPDMVPAVASLGVPYVAMHMRGTPENMQRMTDYTDIAAEVAERLAARAEYITGQGVRELILDPGFGFAKTTRQNYELLHGLDRICALGYPVLCGLSRKSMIYKVLEATPAEVLPGTVALDWEALRKGARILRVHDVKEAVQVVRLFNYYNESI